MATSGSDLLVTTRAKIVYFALRQVQAVALGASPSAALTRDANYMLNTIVKSLQATGLHVWTETQGVLFPQVGQVKYGLGGRSLDRAAGPYYETTTTANANVGDTSVSVATQALAAVGDTVGIVLDNGAFQWVTLTAASGYSLSFSGSPLSDSAAAGTAVLGYTAPIVRPLKITEARRHNILSGIDTPLVQASRMDYLLLPQKLNKSSINQWFYDPQLGTGYVYLWNAPLAIDEYVRFTWWRPIQNFESAGDNPDLPEEWISALQWNLALELTVEHPVSDRVYQRIQMNAAKYLDNVAGFDREEGSVYFQPGRRR